MKKVKKAKKIKTIYSVQYRCGIYTEQTFFSSKDVALQFLDINTKYNKFHDFPPCELLEIKIYDSLKSAINDKCARLLYGEIDW